jgi:hypothetical protein
MKFEELFVDIQTAKELRSIGFNVPCIARFQGGLIRTNTLGNWYDHNSGEISKSYISAPMLTQVKDWFLTEHGIYVVPDICSTGDEVRWSVVVVKDMLEYAVSMFSGSQETPLSTLANSFTSEREALLYGFRRAIAKIKQES